MWSPVIVGGLLDHERGLSLAQMRTDELVDMDRSMEIGQKGGKMVIEGRVLISGVD